MKDDENKDATVNDEDVVEMNIVKYDMWAITVWDNPNLSEGICGILKKCEGYFW